MSSPKLKSISKSIAKLTLVGTCLIASACQNKPKVHPWEEPQNVKVENPATLTENQLLSKVTDVAVLPFLDNTREQEHTLNFVDLKGFAEKFSSHLVGSGTFKNITYPASALESLSGTALSLNRNDDLKEIGNLLDVDAIIFGVIHSYNMYQPPRMSISMKFYLTRSERFATATEISALAHSGVPLNHYNPTFFKQLWNKSAFYDSSSSIFKGKLDTYLKSHDSSSYGFGDQRFVRTKRDFIDFLSFDLASSINYKTNEDDNTYVVPAKKGKRVKKTPRPYFND